jgi:hypothetical protein
MTKAIPSLLPNLDCVLGVRESIGADIQRVQLITRRWSGRERGDGDYTDEVLDVRPTPSLRSLAHNVRLTEGGSIKATDLFIGHISKNQFPNESDVDCSSSESTVERFYRIGQYDYTVISVVEKHLTWDVQVRRRSSQPDNQDWRQYEAQGP